MAVIEDDEPVTTKFHPEEALVRSQDANMIFCTIRFQYKEQKWIHCFEVRKGQKIIDLKRKMAAGNRNEASWFDLYKNGLPSNDNDIIDQDLRLDFAYLPPGSEARIQNKSSDKKQTISKQEEQEKKKDNPLNFNVDVVVRHAIHEDRQVTVTVKASTTAMGVRLKVAEFLGTQLPQVKLLSRVRVGSYKAVQDRTLLGEIREFWSSCDALAKVPAKLTAPTIAPVATPTPTPTPTPAPASTERTPAPAPMEPSPEQPAPPSAQAPPKDLQVDCHISRDLGLKHTLQVKEGSTILSLKKLVADSDITGTMQPCDIKLSHEGKVLPDDACLTEAQTDLDVEDVCI